MSSHPEALFISAVIQTENASGISHSGLTSDFFHVYPTEYRWLERYITRFGKTPTRTTFRLKFTDFPFRKVDDVPYLADEVKKEHARFLITTVMDESLEWVERDDFETALRVLRAGIPQVETTVSGGDSGSFSLLTDTESIYADVKRRIKSASERGFAGIPTAFPSLDLVTGGYQPGSYNIIAGRTGQGKTWTLVAIAIAAMKTGANSLFVTLEQPKNVLTFRFHNLLSSDTSLARKVFSNTCLSAGRAFSLVEYRKFLENLKSSSNLGDISIIDGTRGRVSGVTLAAAIERTKPRIVFVDYLTLLDTKDKDWQSVAKLSGEIQSLAQRYEIPIVAAAQVNRLGVGRQPPLLSQIGMSDSIGQDADSVVTLAQQSTHVIKFRLAKNRNGQDQGSWYCQFDPGSGVISEISGDRARELIDLDSDE